MLPRTDSPHGRDDGVRATKRPKAMRGRPKGRRAAFLVYGVVFERIDIIRDVDAIFLRDRFPLDNPCGDADRGRPGGDVDQDQSHRADLRSLAHSYAAYDVRACSHLDSVLEDRSPPSVVAVPHRDAVSKGAIRANHGLLVNDDAAEMIDPEARSDLDHLGDADSREELDRSIQDLVEDVDDPSNGPASPAFIPTTEPIEPQGPDRGFPKEGLRWVPPKVRLPVWVPADLNPSALLPFSSLRKPIKTGISLKP